MREQGTFRSDTAPKATKHLVVFVGVMNVNNIEGILFSPIILYDIQQTPMQNKAHNICKRSSSFLFLTDYANCPTVNVKLIVDLIRPEVKNTLIF